MRTFRYSALTSDGMPKKGIVKAVDEFEAVDKIKINCPVVVKITPVRESKSILDMEVGSNKIKQKNIAVMCSQFSIILKSGVNISRAMQMISEQTEDKKLKKMLSEASESISEGVGIAEAIERSGKGLPTSFIETVRAGEYSGTLEKSFKALEVYFTRSYKSTQKIKQALTYPIFVIMVAVVVLMVVMAKVIPALTATFNDLGGELPGITRFMISMSNFFEAHWFSFILFNVAILGLIKLSSLTNGGHAFWSKVLLKLPVIGRINILSGSSQFASTMGVLLSSGLSIDNAIETTSKSMSNYILGQEIGNMTIHLQEGRSLGDCIRRCNYFPNTLKEMCNIGEETGELDQTLITIGDYFDNEVSYAMKQAINKLEPALLIGLAIFAIIIVFAIYMPIFTMYNYM